MWRLAAVSLLAAALPAGAAADVPLGPPINVPPDTSRVYSVPLTAGVTYRLVLTGTVTEANVDGMGVTYTYDANRLIDGLIPNSILRVYYAGAEPAVNPYYWSLNQSTLQPPPDPSHRYEVTFTAARSSPLEARVLHYPSGRFVYKGGFTLELFGPAPAPGPGPAGGGSPGGEKPPTIVSSTTWGKPGPPTALGPGDEAIALGPQIASGQTQTSVTVSGDRAAETEIVTGTPTRSRPATKLTGGDCVRAAVQFGKSTVVEGSPRISGNTSYDKLFDKAREQIADDAALLTVLFLSACLEYVREQDKQANPAALRHAVGAARLSCGVRTASLSVRVDRAAKRISYRSRRASRRGPARRLRVSCRKARNGTVTMRIKTRSRRTKLRKVLGKRLVVGLYRSRAATGTANVQTTFKRR